MSTNPKPQAKTRTEAEAPKKPSDKAAPKQEAKPKPRKPRKRRERREFPARVKCEAVLALWSDRRTPTEICEELEIPWQQLQNWQGQALEAMIIRLEPRPTMSEPALSKRLQKLLEQTEARTSRKSRLEERLEKIQNPEPSPPREGTET